MLVDHDLVGRAYPGADVAPFRASNAEPRAEHPQQLVDPRFAGCQDRVAVLVKLLFGRCLFLFQTVLRCICPYVIIHRLHRACVVPFLNGFKPVQFLFDLDRVNGLGLRF